MKNIPNAVYSTLEWNHEVNSLNQFIVENKLPTLATISKLQFEKFDLNKNYSNCLSIVYSTITSHLIISEGFSLNHKTKQLFSIPINYDGWVEIVTEDLKQIRPLLNFEDIIEKTPIKVLVRENIKAFLSLKDGQALSINKTRIVIVGEVITCYKKKFMKIETTKGIVNKEFIQAKDSQNLIIYFDKNQRISFSKFAEENSLIGIQKLKQILNNFKLPLNINIVYGHLAPDIKKNFLSTFKLLYTQKENVLSISTLEPQFKVIIMPLEEPIILKGVKRFEKINNDLIKNCLNNTKKYLENNLNTIKILKNAIPNFRQVITNNSKLELIKLDSIKKEPEHLLYDEIEEIYYYIRHGGDIPKPKELPKSDTTEENNNVKMSTKLNSETLESTIKKNDENITSIETFPQLKTETTIACENWNEPSYDHMKKLTMSKMTKSIKKGNADSQLVNFGMEADNLNKDIKIKKPIKNTLHKIFSKKNDKVITISREIKNNKLINNKDIRSNVVNTEKSITNLIEKINENIIINNNFDNKIDLEIDNTLEIVNNFNNLFMSKNNNEKKNNDEINISNEKNQNYDENHSHLKCSTTEVTKIKIEKFENIPLTYKNELNRKSKNSFTEQNLPLNSSNAKKYINNESEIEKKLQIPLKNQNFNKRQFNQLNLKVSPPKDIKENFNLKDKINNEKLKHLNIVPRKSNLNKFINNKNDQFEINIDKSKHTNDIIKTNYDLNIEKNKKFKSTLYETDYKNSEKKNVLDIKSRNNYNESAQINEYITENNNKNNMINGTLNLNKKIESIKLDNKSGKMNDKFNILEDKRKNMSNGIHNENFISISNVLNGRVETNNNIISTAVEDNEINLIQNPDQNLNRMNNNLEYEKTSGLNEILILKLNNNINLNENNLKHSDNKMNIQLQWYEINNTPTNLIDDSDSHLSEENQNLTKSDTLVLKDNKLLNISNDFTEEINERTKDEIFVKQTLKTNNVFLNLNNTEKINDSNFQQNENNNHLIQKNSNNLLVNKLEKDNSLIGKENSTKYFVSYESYSQLKNEEINSKLDTSKLNLDFKNQRIENDDITYSTRKILPPELHTPGALNFISYKGNWIETPDAPGINNYEQENLSINNAYHDKVDFNAGMLLKFEDNRFQNFTNLDNYNNINSHNLELNKDELNTKDKIKSENEFDDSFKHTLIIHTGTDKNKSNPILDNYPSADKNAYDSFHFNINRVKITNNQSEFLSNKNSATETNYESGVIKNCITKVKIGSPNDNKKSNNVLNENDFKIENKQTMHVNDHGPTKILIQHSNFSNRISPFNNNRSVIISQNRLGYPVYQRNGIPIKSNYYNQ